MVVDTSALLALFFEEKNASWVAETLKAHKERLLMSTVNLTETFILLKDRVPKKYLVVRDQLLKMPIIFVPPSVSQAEMAAEARLKYPLNLGDCFAYALATEQRCAILAVDRDFKATDAAVILPNLS